MGKQNNSNKPTPVKKVQSIEGTVVKGSQIPKLRNPPPPPPKTNNK